MIDYRVYLVTDEPSRYLGPWLDNILAAVEGGVTCVQYRDTENPRPAQYERIRALQDALRSKRIPIVVNNDAELAASVGAEGIHVGQHDLPPPAVRTIVGRNCEIGYSITSLADIKTFCNSEVRYAVDCLGIGPVFDATKTKVDAAPAMGPEGLSEIVKQVPEFNNCAIGGITLANAATVIAAGAKGLAIVSAFSKAEDPYATAKSFSMLFDHCRQ